MDKCNIFWKWATFLLVGILFGVLLNTVNGSDWDERVLTRDAIEKYDIVIQYIDEGKYNEAETLADAVSTSMWYLRNSKITRTKFYDDLRPWFLGSYASDNPEAAKQEIIKVQVKLCPKSDLSGSYLQKEITFWKNKTAEIEYISGRARC